MGAPVNRYCSFHKKFTFAQLWRLGQALVVNPGLISGIKKRAAARFLQDIDASGANAADVDLADRCVIDVFHRICRLAVDQCFDTKGINNAGLGADLHADK